MEVQGCTNVGSREIYSSTEVPISRTTIDAIANRITKVVYFPTNRYSYLSEEAQNQNLVVTHYYQFTQPTPSPVPKFEPRPSPIPATTRQPTMASLTRQSSIQTKINIQPITAPSSNTRAEGSQLPFPASKVVQSRGL
ncbi:hypothetical protein O181_047483 [Austropuccinia psidii MF-1]|uniref:Uncharacterized protein n=1 Tax=Austropuccinia psidii MF-1 TaxID=1389203 RepID=A0A9Q3DU39_9BASI|nr:hypothetical protein [Austropuccinia psidii MF-1]